MFQSAQALIFQSVCECMCAGTLWKCSAGTVWIGPRCPSVGQHDRCHYPNQLHPHGKRLTTHSAELIFIYLRIWTWILHFWLSLWQQLCTLFTRGKFSLQFPSFAYFKTLLWFSGFKETRLFTSQEKWNKSKTWITKITRLNYNYEGVFI